MWRAVFARRLGLAATPLASAWAYTSLAESKPDGLTSLRKTDFTLADHNHGKARVRVLRVRHDSSKHTVQEYSVSTRLFSPSYGEVFTSENNGGLVATDTQKNTVYVVAKRSSATTPEGYGADLARHFLREYPVLSAVEVDVDETIWERVITKDGQPHDHGFLKVSPEVATARVRVTREAPDKPEVVAGIRGLTVLKTTQSGFSDYLLDKYTLLKETGERCLATQITSEWKFVPQPGKKEVDYAAVREGVRQKFIDGFFGPPTGGIFSVSLQATVYDIGCTVLSAEPQVASISIDTPNIHYIPFGQLKDMGEKFEDDVYIATSDPSGSIHCTVSR